jgi:hypothetical protein
MEDALRDELPVPFPEVPGVVHETVDRATGLRAVETAGCVELIRETFLEGTEPTEECSAAEHARLRLPWVLARYELDEQGALVVPTDDLSTLLATEPTLAVDTARNTLSVASPEGPVTLPFRVVAGGTPRMPGSLEGTVDPAGLIGKDGRPAEVVLLGEAARTEPR